MVELHPEAEKEYLETLVFYKNQSLKAAQMFSQEFEKLVSKIVLNPNIGVEYKRGYRKFISIKFHFSIIYKKTESAIYIVSVADHHRIPDYWIKRE